MNDESLFNEANRATYCPEDNKLRLYVGRVPRAEYDALRAEGWVSTPKQDCDFVAHWTPHRRDTAMSYAGIIEDEDQGPEDRAADRAERFDGYLGKRLGEATGHADHYDSNPAAHGFQDARRAERSAQRHDRIAHRATDAWDKAEYWQRRTAGVIAHALHVSSPAVRMGRMKQIETELRKYRESLEKYATKFSNWQAVAKLESEEHQRRAVVILSQCDYGDEYTHPITGHRVALYHIAECLEVSPVKVAEIWLNRHAAPVKDTEWTRHLELRLAYENQMLEAQGGRAGFLEMEVGGWIGKHQIRKVNKSNASGRVVSVTVAIPSNGCDRWGNQSDKTPAFHLRVINVERLDVSAYTAPTAADKDALETKRQEEKALAPAKDACPLINPTDADAERLLAILNSRQRVKHCEGNQRQYGRDYAEEFEPAKIVRITQAQYSAASKGSYARTETRGICSGANFMPRSSNMWSASEEEYKKRIGKPLAMLRVTKDGKTRGYPFTTIIVLTDKPQKPLPSNVWPATADASGQLQLV